MNPATVLNETELDAWLKYLSNEGFCDICKTPITECSDAIKTHIYVLSQIKNGYK